MKKVNDGNSNNGNMEWKAIDGYEGLYVSVRKAVKDKNGSVMFTPFNLRIDADEYTTVYLYDNKIVPYNGGSFISYSSRKGKDDKYYSNSYIKMTDEMKTAIIEAVEHLGA